MTALSINVKNLSIWLLSYLKKKNDLSSEITKKFFVFQENETYNLSSGNHSVRKNIQTTQYGSESFSNLGAKLWNLLPREIKSCSPFTVFKTKLENRLLKNVYASFVRHI